MYGSVYIEAPIFGRLEAAVARSLWIPFAGPQRAKERVRPLLQAMGGQGIFDFGEEVGAATLVKLVGNFLIISAARSLVDSSLSLIRASIEYQNLCTSFFRLENDPERNS